jgi:hypothetical protein
LYEETVAEYPTGDAPAPSYARERAMAHAKRLESENAIAVVYHVTEKGSTLHYGP